MTCLLLSEKFWIKRAPVTAGNWRPEEGIFLRLQHSCAQAKEIQKYHFSRPDRHAQPGFVLFLFGYGYILATKFFERFI